MSHPLPTVAQLQRAIQIIEKIDALEIALQAALAGHGGSAREVFSAPLKGPKGKRKMSSQGRARIAAAQKLRWATRRAGVPAVSSLEKPAKPAGRKKRSFSPEARAKMAAAAKKRWAKVRRAKA